MSGPRSTFECAFGALALLGATAAEAQTPPTPANVLARACEGRSNQALSRAEIAQALVTEAHIPIADRVGDTAVPASTQAHDLADLYGEAIVQRVRAILGSTTPSPARRALRVGVNTLQDRLNDQPEGVTVVRPDGEPIELFGEGEPRWRITCGQPDAVRRIEDPPAPPARFALRETAEELWLTGQARRKAGAFSLGFERSQTTLDDGTTRTETSFTIDGTAGLRITPASSRNMHAYLFGTYNLQRDRARPAPALGPGESQSDGDTDALAIGVDGHLRHCLGGCVNGLPLDLNLQAATIFDFANDSRRIGLRALLTPRPVMDLGLCRIGVFSTGPLRRRCEFSAEVQAAHVLRRGRTELGNYDSFLAVGGRASIEFFLPSGAGEEKATGFLASIRYRYLPVLHGAPNAIERFEARLAHRFWTSRGAGIDVGFTYTNGTNELSFEEEDVLTFGAGIIF